MHVQETVEDVRDASQRIGAAAESQAALNVVLTVTAVTALLVAALLIHNVGGSRA